ncbi:hypothetical protein AAG570_002379, partial [Ranatra chinensis]
AYGYYIESLKLVAGALKSDLASYPEEHLTLKDKKNLIEFAKQSISRVSLLIKKDANILSNKTTPAVDWPIYVESAPPVEDMACMWRSNQSEEETLVSRYRKRLNGAGSAHERQNLELELARQLVEKAAITRNRMMQATAWAMHNAHMKFHIQEKLKGGTLKESDFRKQQLYALALHFTEGNSWLKQCVQDLNMYPNNEKLTRELLGNILTDNEHPIRCSMINMQSKIQQMLSSTDQLSSSEMYRNHFKTIADEIKEDLAILLEVLKVLYEPLNVEKNSSITSELVNHFYFAPLKSQLILLIRQGLKDKEEILTRAWENGCSDCFGYGSDIIQEDARSEAVTKIHYLTTLHNPYEMIDCAVHIIKLLTTSQFDRNHFTSIGADCLLPRLCAVVTESRLIGVAAEAEYMETFMPSEKALGEEGYAVTMLQSVVAHLTGGCAIGDDHYDK